MKKIILSIIMLLFLPGCLDYIQEVKLYPDGSGKMKINYWMLSPDKESISIIDKIGIFNPDSIRKEFTSPFSSIDNIEVYADTTDSTTHAVIDLSFTHIDSLNKAKAFSEADFSLKDGASGQKIFSQFIPPIATGFGIDGSAFQVTYKYTFSGEIVTHNAQTVEKRTLIWNYTLAEIGSGKTISVTFKPYRLKETPYWIYILSGIVLLIVIVFLFRKKKD
ncbi:MAG: hypothetical protein ABI550_05190 [Ignavibacteriaceae bacterium]